MSDTFLGDGGFGEVHLVFNPTYNVEVALKRRQISYRFENETRALVTFR